MSRPRLGWPFLLALAVILALAGWVRVSCFPMVLATGELVPRLDGDSHYHLGRILDAVAHFPRVRHFDPSMNWPAGAFVPWADGFDLGGAAFALLAGGGDPARRAMAVALWPVVLGLLTVVATVALVLVTLPGRPWRGAALAAGVSAALFPVAVGNSSLARVDHHVFEALLVALLAWWALQRLPARPGPVTASPPPLRFEVTGALLSGLGVFGFTGAPIYVAVVAAPLAWAAWRDRKVLGAGGPGLVAGGLLSAALSAPAVLDHHLALSFKYPSLLQPGLLVLAGGGVMAAALIGAGVPGHRRGRWLGSLAALLVILAGLAVLGRGAVAEIRGAVTGWLLHRDPWISQITEFSPLFAFGDPAKPPWLRTYWDLGAIGFTLPAAAALVAWRLRRRPRALGLLWCAAAMTLLALVQNRFDRPLVPFASVVTGVASAVLVQRLGRAFRPARAALAAPALLAIATLADPFTASLLEVSGDMLQEPVQELAMDLRARPLPPGAPGLLSNWSYGHQLQVQGGVPVAVNGFGSYLDDAAFWRAVRLFEGGPDPLDQYMRDGRFGGLVGGAATVGAEVVGASESPSFSQGALNRPYMTSVPLSPLMIAGSAVPGWNVRHLPHLMPRHASRASVSGLSFPLPYLWSYERVAGATVRGTARPGARVLAELKFTEHHRPHTYKAFADAAADGRWELVLPFPSGLVRPALRSAARWTIAAGGAARDFALDEAAVRRGATLELGALEGAP